MSFDFLKEDDGNTAGSAVGILLISGTCCNPNLKVADNQALRVIEQAAAETAVEVRVRTISMSSAFYSAPKNVSRKLAGDFAAGRIGVPAVLIGGEAVSYGAPSLELMKTALLKAAEAKMKETTNE